MTPPHWIHRHAPPKAMSFELGGGNLKIESIFVVYGPLNYQNPTAL